MKISTDLERCIRDYLAIVDSEDESRQGDERTMAHERLMEQMRAEGIPFENDRVKARLIARWLLSNNNSTSADSKRTTVMFARTLGKAHPAEVGTPEIVALPRGTEFQEEYLIHLYTPVLITITPLVPENGEHVRPVQKSLAET